MKKAAILFAVVAWFGATIAVPAQSTDLTYEGRLDVAGTPANGNYDLTFSLFDSSTGGNQQGTVITNIATAITNGLFIVNLDFGNEFPGTPRWLEIAVRTNGGGTFTALSPRQPITSTPYAIQSVNATSASVAATATSVPAGNVSGILSTAQLPATVITNGASSVTISGNFSGNGSGLTGVPGTLPWNQVTGTNATASANQAYLLNNNSLTTLSLPATANPGDVVAVSSTGSNGWQAVVGYNLSAVPVFTAQSSPGLPWKCVASSADGTKLVAVTYNESLNTLHDSGIYTSTNSGVSWTTQTGGLATSGFSGWQSVASSADGTKLVAVQYPGQIFTSTNSGVSWTVQSAPSTNWASVASSADGTKLAAAAIGGLIYTSTNAGTTWTPQVGSGSQSWYAIASSADGTKLVAATYNENLNTLHDSGIYTSSDSGITWTRQTNGLPTSNFSSWSSVACSADGTKIAAASQVYLIYTSTNAGANWTGQNNSTDEYWSSVASSASGSELVAVAYPLGNQFAGQIGVSANWGNSWALQSNAITWESIAVSSDGTKLVAVSQNSPIYTAGQPPIYFNGAAGTYTEFQFVGSGIWQPLGSSASQIVGNIAPANLPPGLITNGATAVNLGGTFTGSGAGLTNVSLTSLNSYGSISWPGSFNAAFSLKTGGLLSSVVASDINGDGRLDMIFADATSNTLTVLTNDGSGNFLVTSVLPVGGGPASVIAADINSDGKIDLICANQASNSLTVLTNNGVGIFSVSSTLTVGNGPVSVATADFNGDGKLDLVCANESGNTLTVLTNNGSGGFALAATLNVGNAPVWVVATNINGNVRPDLVCANSGDNTLSVFTNNGSGGFGLVSTVAVGNSPECVVAADINGDGKVDLITANNGDATLTVLTNDGTGNYVASSILGAPGVPTSVAAADVNGDGKVDLICANQLLSAVNGTLGGSLTVYTNDGGGNFAVASSPFAPSVAIGSFATGDVNSDGKVDLICVGTRPKTKGEPIGEVAVILNAPAFTGDGSRLVNLNASELTSGILPSTVLQGEYTNRVIFDNPANAFIGDGYGLTDLNASSLASGTVADSLLSANVALRAGGNAFTGDQSIAGNLGLGTASSTIPLTFANSLGDKIALYNSTATNSYGFGISNFTLQIHTDTPAADVAFGSGSSTNLAETMRIRGNGRVGIGSTTPQQMLQVGDSSKAGSTGIIHFASHTSNPVGSAARDWDVGVPQTGDSATGIGYSFVVHDDGIAYPAQLLVQYSTGNVGIANTNPGHLLVVGNNASPAYCDGTTWVSQSDRNAKENFADIDPTKLLDRVLSLPLQSWSYKAHPENRHIGPMAQDFHEAFGLNGTDDTHIATVDEDGIALAAIQGLNRKLEEQIKEKDAKIDALEQRLQRLEKLADKLEPPH